MNVSPQDLDLITRTALAEGGVDGPEGISAVANVIRNRLQSGKFGGSIPSIVYQPNAFEAWSLNRRDPNYPGGFSARDPNYQRAYSIAQNVFSDINPDPTRGALYYYNPSLQSALGRKAPSFSQYPLAATIGRQQFYSEPQARDANGFARVSNDDIAETAHSFGLSEPAGPPPIQAPAPASALPAMAVTPDDVAATVKALSLNQPQQVATSQAPALPAGVTPEIESAAQKIAPYYGAQGFGEGMPIIGPLMDKASAAVEALVPGQGTFSDRYAKNLAVQQEAYRLWSKQHPVQALAENTAGAGMALAPAAQTTVGAAALGLPNATRLGATLGGRFYTGAAGGAAINALDAAARGQDPRTGAIVGTVLGGAGPLVGEAVGRGVEATLPYLTHVDPALQGINQIGRNWLTNALANETPQSITAATERMGPHGFLADINPGLTNLATGVASGGEVPGSTAVAEAYRVRDAAQRGVIDSALSRAFGNPVNLVHFQDMITENRAAAADPLYQQWRAMQVHPTPELKALMPRLEAAGAFKSAEELGAIRGTPINQNFFTGGPQKAYPTTQTWDLAKQGLDRRIDAAYSAGDKKLATSLIQLKGELIDEIGKTPAGQVWNQARSEFADRSQLLDQIHAGRDDFLGSRSGLSVDELRDELSGLSGPELQARLVGQRAAADEVMGATLNGDTTLRNKFLAPNNQAKLRLSLGDARADELISTLEQQQYLSGQNRYVNPRAGSATAPRSQAVNALQPPPLPEWNPNIAQPLSFIPPHVIDAIRPSNVLMGGRQQAYAQARQQIVPALLSRGNTMADLITALQGNAANRALAARRGSAANALTTGAITGPALQALRQRGNFGFLPNPISAAQ